MFELCLRDGLLRRLVVLVGPLDGTVHADQAGAYLPGLGQDLVQAHLVAGDPAAVQPEDVQLPVAAAGEFRELVLREGHVVLIPVGVLVHLVVDAPARGGVVRIPEPFAVPVGLGEVGADQEALRTEGVEDVLGDVLPGVRGEWSGLGDGKVRVFGIEHAESVVVLRREDHVLHAGVFEDIGPLLRVEVHRVEDLG